ncbi:MAG: hypothetical protein AB8G99_26720 [Planctomycetaceae bacterium]
MSEFCMLVGFALAAYSIVANDSIQTLGTFLSSNHKRPWWLLWAWISSILVVTVLWGWYASGGDPAFGRLDKKGIDLPSTFNWLYVVPPLVLVLLTRAGIPVSTSLLVLSAFATLTALQAGEPVDMFEPGGSAGVFSKMLKKSLVGYVLAAAVGLLAYGLIIVTLERRFQNDREGRDNPHPAWFVFQWLSTGFLWSMWLVQDLANVFVYLPRRLGGLHIGLALAGMVLTQAYIIRSGGGKIQKVVAEKTNTVDLRSATFIDFFYGLVLLFFKVDYIPKLFASAGWTIPWPPKMPMSTTWVFLGLLAGRELGMWLRLRHCKSNQLRGFISRDLGKVAFGTAVSVAVAFGIPYAAMHMGLGTAKTGTVAESVESPVSETPAATVALPSHSLATTP